MENGSNDKAPGIGQRVDIADPFAKRLMAHYLGRREADLELFRSALAKKDFDSIRVRGHNLYGSGGAYGLTRVSELGELFERAAVQENREEIQTLIERLETYLRELKIA